MNSISFPTRTYQISTATWMHSGEFIKVISYKLIYSFVMPIHLLAVLRCQHYTLPTKQGDDAEPFFIFIFNGL